MRPHPLFPRRRIGSASAARRSDIAIGDGNIPSATRFATPRRGPVPYRMESIHLEKRAETGEVLPGRKTGVSISGELPIPTAHDYVESNDAGVKNMPLIKYRRNNVDTI